MNRALRAARGYTVVEVLSAMTLFAIGAAGVISMQRVTIMGGDDARRMDIATNLAHEWTARLQRDASFWTRPNANDQTTNYTDTLWLQNLPLSTTTSQTAWLTPSVSGGVPGRSGSFDIFGQDRPADSNDHIFCAQYRLAWITPPGTAPPFRVGASMRAEVRVFWARLDNPIIASCADATPDSATAKTYYHFVYAATAIRPNPANYGSDAGP
jgi:hypothetical protein